MAKKLWLSLIIVLPFAAAGFVRSTSSGTALESDGLIITVYLAGRELRLCETDYLIGVIAGQMPITYEMETLKAQAVLVRSSLYKCAEGRSSVDAAEIGFAWCSDSQLRSKWGIHTSANKKKLREAVEATGHAVVKYDEQVVSVPYFAVSSGRTRSSEDAWRLDIPWLVAVDSEWDRQSEKAEVDCKLTCRQLNAILKAAVPDYACEAVSLAATCQILKVDESGYVTQLQIGNRILTGEDFRYIVGLDSACFQMNFEGRKVTITSSGVGHGVGFDQYGANEQAKLGKVYDALLRYYLKGVKVCE